MSFESVFYIIISLAVFSIAMAPFMIVRRAIKLYKEEKDLGSLLFAMMMLLIGILFILEWVLFLLKGVAG